MSSSARHALFRPATTILPRLRPYPAAQPPRLSHLTLTQRHLPRRQSLTTTTTTTTTTTMLHSAKQQEQLDPAAATTTAAASNEKLIFAPGEHGQLSSQAGQFTKGTLDRGDLAASPLTQFHAWFGDAAAAGVEHPETATLATAHLPSGRVSARVVYLKELDARGFVAYSAWWGDATSRKAADVASNPRAALVFWWPPLERQVRVEGAVERLPAAESQVYFDTRARGSRVGAWASRQSEPLPGREALEHRVRDVERRFEGEEKIPVPPFWGGARIVPDEVEFWQGRESRLHDRFRYTRDEGVEGGWRVERLSP